MRKIDNLSVVTLVAEVGAVVLSALRLLYSQMPVEHPPGVDTLKL